MARHDPEILKQMIPHLRYEANAMREAYELTFFTGRNSIIGNAALESFLLHSRILLEFLYHSKDHEDKVTARDYIPEWTKERRFSSETLKFFDQTREALNARLGHLSKERLNVKEDKADWDTKRIVNELEAAIKRFLDVLPPTWLQPDSGAS